MKRNLTSAEKWLLVTPLALLLLPLILRQSSPEDRLNAEVLELAGTDATACGYLKNPRPYAEMNSQMQTCMMQAFKQKKSFWTQERKTSLNMHTGEESEYWQSYVSTPEGRVFTLMISNKQRLLTPKIRCLRWVNPHLKMEYRWANPDMNTQCKTERLGGDNEFEVELQHTIG